MNETSGCTQTGESLSILKNVILDQWERLVREVISSSKHESSVILQDHIPHLLGQLELILKSGVIDEVELGKSHGYYRSTLTDFSVADIMTEYSLLRETLIAYLYPMGDMDCSKLIHKFVDILAKHAVVEFMNDQITHRSLSYEPIGSEVKELIDNPVINPLDH